ncbi:hypothetical protein GQR36_08580 [Enterococcus termitis]
MINTMYGKSILDLTELTKSEFLAIIELAVAVKKSRKIIKVR